MLPEDIFEKILKMRALSVIHAYAADHLDFQNDQKTEAALFEIMNTNDLDIAWAVAHEQLGQMEQAQVLRRWVDQRNARKKALE